MTTVPYIYVQITALFCYTLFMVALLAAKKDAVINTFLLWIFDFFLWTGGSVLMRLGVGPDYRLWYDVSFLALMAMPLFAYLFFCSIAKVKAYLTKALFALGTVVILVLSVYEVFIDRPIKTVVNGRTVFQYNMDAMALIPLAFSCTVVFFCVRAVVKMIREQGIRSPGHKCIIAGCIILIVGNFVSAVPGNYFPFDTLSGIINALLIFYALYKKRLFKLTLLVSKNTLIFISIVLVALLCSYIITPLNNFLTTNIPELGEYTVVVVSTACVILIGIFYLIIKKAVNVIFFLYKDEQAQSRSIERFSASASKSLNTNEILKELTAAISENINAKKIYICLKKNDAYTVKYGASPFDKGLLSISKDNPCITYLESGESCILMNEFKGNPLYRSMWEEEKRMFEEYGIACITAIKVDENIIGLILLAKKQNNRAYNYDDTVFLSTVAMIVGISVKNAQLYEQIYRESRYDTLTELYNHKSFLEISEREFEKAKGGSSLALLLIDLDDFKLYNQLYGTEEGDKMLKMVAQAILRCVGDDGYVFRYSSKVFAVLFPGYDVKSTHRVAECIKYTINGINDAPERRLFKKITVSGGICVYPYAASNIREMIDNADLAVFNAKNNGKNNIAVYTLEDRKTTNLSTGVSLLENGIAGEQQNPSMYNAYASTIYALSAAIDAKDKYTFRHSQNVAKYSTILATANGMNKEHVRIIYEAALLHDIGKISIPEHILTKNGALTSQEYEIMKTHVNSSIEMIRHLPSMDYVIPAVIGHHERWDGKGYPRGIARENIPLSARCLAIADAFDAMTTNRSYRKALPVEYAAEEIIKNAGTQFDPELASIFADLIKSKEITVENQLSLSI